MLEGADLSSGMRGEEEEEEHKRITSKESLVGSWREDQICTRVLKKYQIIIFCDTAKTDLLWAFLSSRCFLESDSTVGVRMAYLLTVFASIKSNGWVRIGG